ncbi:Mitochondrial intermembrane space cysteine motif-containing protein MIX17 [Sphaceloma murrayae]|uniref:Mitochondrial intermembrane space cysteine motif-containing protein MIX17 n=1 Tax=Sphaceloma murrayae TaxID=2082308 RepID=A0A2K1QX07_9PEZI|nr:Mitochondrial intermembrane space cysteine motif-containing protein MIX17 [Sphaceloma murrayae]
MPRQRGGASAPRRPTAAPAAPPRPAPQQSRPSSTAAHPPAQQQAPAQQGSGLFGQMASTAAGVAVGSSIGHAIGGFFGGGSSAPAAEQQSQLPAENTYNSTGTQYSAQGACANDVTNFRRCMDENQGSLTICGWYLDQLKACQQAASQY